MAVTAFIKRLKCHGEPTDFQVDLGLDFGVGHAQIPILVFEPAAGNRHLADRGLATLAVAGL